MPWRPQIPNMSPDIQSVCINAHAASGNNKTNSTSNKK